MTDLDARYGRTSRRGGIVGVVVASAVIVALAVWWFVWADPVGTGPSLEWQDNGFQSVSDGQVDATFLVTLDPGNAAQCAVEALDESFAVVGWRIVDVPSSGDRMRTFTVPIRTTEHPVTGTVHDCWVVAP